MQEKAPEAAARPFLQFVQIGLLLLVLVVGSLIYFRPPEAREAPAPAPAPKATGNKPDEAEAKLLARERAKLAALREGLKKDLKTIEGRLEAIEEGLKQQGEQLKGVGNGLRQQDRAIKGVAAGLEQQDKAIKGLARGRTAPAAAEAPASLANDLRDLKKELARLNKSLSDIVKFAIGSTR